MGAKWCALLPPRAHDAIMNFATARIVLRHLKYTDRTLTRGLTAGVADAGDLPGCGGREKHPLHARANNPTWLNGVTARRRMAVERAKRPGDGESVIICCG